MKYFDYRYIYLMRKSGTRKHKIGISNNPQTRRATVDKGITGKVNLIIARRVIFARRVEQYIHGVFSDSRFTFWRAGKESGRTEWFDLNWLERFFVRFWIEIFGLIPVILAALLIWVLYMYGDQMAWPEF
jgi:hypothetical protein